jgi:hypothetical protein
MKLSRRAFVLGCGATFLLAGTFTCAVRAKYRSIPREKVRLAYVYAANLERFSFLQYNQAPPDRGREALGLYLKFLQRIRRENIPYPQNTLHADFGLTYLRLYRLESADDDSVAAAAYMKAARKEWSPPGSKAEVSEEVLTRLIETRETNEQRLYTDAGVQLTNGQKADRGGAK